MREGGGPAHVREVYLETIMMPTEGGRYMDVETKGGINNKILRVDLDTGSIAVEEPGEGFFRQYFGGRGLIAHYLLKEVPKGTDPLGPENLFIMSAGPLTGAPFAGAGRHSVGAKSPLTGAYGDGEAGGFWGAELKKAGLDAIIVKGVSSDPVYLYVEDGQAEIRDASHLKGRPTLEVQEALEKELGDVRVLQCGPAGENLVPLAAVTADLRHWSGRTGMGAVMGSKNLRAVAVKGTADVKVSDPERVRELARWMAGQKEELWNRMYDTGTPGIIMGLNASGGLPTHNFRDGHFDGAQDISGETLRDNLLTGRESCFACPVRCKRVVESQEPYQIHRLYGGPEYETIGSLGSTCGVRDLAAICKGHEVCGALGLDTIGAGVAIGFAMECFEEGILTLEDTGGVDLSFGNAEAMLDLLDKIARREGLGKLLSKGVKRAAEELGPEAMELAMHVKGQEIPMHEPRLKHGLGIGYMVSATGADHCHNLHDTAYTKNVKDLNPFGILQPLESDDLSPAKVRMFRQVTGWRTFFNCAHICYFVPWKAHQVVDLVSSVTGWNTSLHDLMQVGERAAMLAHSFNAREGFTRDQDILPRRFHTPFQDGPLAGVAVDSEKLTKARDLYYSMLGIDQEGRPTFSGLAALGEEWVLDLLEEGSEG